MRISDWSSDVCSSDLCSGRATAARELPAQQLPGMTVDDQGQRQPAIPAAPDAAQVGRPTQIGRASCRERGVSVRVDLGGRRIIKKKQKKPQNKYQCENDYTSLIEHGKRTNYTT